MTLILKEDTADGISPCTATFNSQGGSASYSYIVQDDTTPDQATTASEVQNLVQTILGYSQYNKSNNGNVQRATPLRHPLYPFLYADAVSNLHGYGQYTLTTQDVNLDGNNNTQTILTQWASYPTWRCSVNFSTRPYGVFPDSQVPIKQSTWYDDLTHDASSANAPIAYQYAAEWQRFCKADVLPLDDYITQQFGTMQLSTTDGNTGKELQNQIKMFLPNQVLKLTWYQIPFRYLTSLNSYLAKYKGRVNQNAWNGPFGPVVNPGDTGYFPPGSLLYLTYKPTIYTPPLQAANNVFNNTTGYERMCDIEVDFLWTSRQGTSLPADPNNQNYVVDGHNLQPFPPARVFYYATSTDGKAVPAWLSFPIELLFTDPDSPQPF